MAGSSSPALVSLNQDFQEEREEIEILLRGRKRKRIDLEILGFEANANIGAAEQLREAFKTSAQVEDERVRVVFLQIGDQEIEEERFSRAGPAENHGVGHIAVMEVQKVRRVVVGFENREIFLAEMLVARLATVEGKEK